MKDYIGKIYDSNNYGKFKIIQEAFMIGRNERHFKIQFLNTGYITIASYSAIRHGSVKDYLVPCVAGVGYLGYFYKPVSSPDVSPFYMTWNDMINRCYNMNDKDYYLYGALGIRVDERWFNFSNFYNDIKLIPGYENKIKYPSIYQLDKDYLQMHIPKNQRIYSINTCIWISKFDNIMIMNRENPNASGYFGVYYRNGAYCTRFNNKTYGRFSTPEAAANLFNYLYPAFKNEFNNIEILNDVEPILFNDLPKYAINKNNYIDSTTILLWSTV